MKNKLLSMLAVSLAATAVLAGSAAAHTHETSNVWEVDLENHWKICTDCGEQVEVAAHTLDEADDTCHVCGSHIVDWGDSQSIYQYNEADEPLKLADYDASGALLTETVYRYEYDEDGAPTFSTVHVDGVLTEEYTYATVDGESIIRQSCYYYDDGTRFINGFDDYGHCIQLISYDADGNVDFRFDSEYAQDENGMWYESTCTSVEADSSQSVSEYTANGDQTAVTYYDAEGNLLYSYRWEYTYDAEGNWATMRFYTDDVLSSETIYATVTTQDGTMTYPATEIAYAEDGTQTVLNYDADGNLLESEDDSIS